MRQQTNLEDLKQELPYKWRVQSAKYGKANCVCYIDARDCQDLLDKVVGVENWQSIFYDEGGLLFCKIGIKIEEDEWVWKSDTGSESNIEKDKGHVSDAFKRACVSWGIGRFLYRLPVKVLKAKAHINKKEYPLNEKTGKLIFDRQVLTDYINGLGKPSVVGKITMNVRVLENLLKGISLGKIKEVKESMTKYDMTKEQEKTLTVMINTTK